MRLGTVLCGSSQRGNLNGRREIAFDYNPAPLRQNSETLAMARSGVDDIIRRGATCLATVSYPAYKILASGCISSPVLFKPIISNTG